MELCPQLRRLSADHARWLAAGRRWRGRSVEAQRKRLLATWDQELNPHCRVEEEILLPELTLHVPETDALVLFTIGDHLALRRLARQLRAAEPDARPVALARLLGKLEEHFRFEERTLLPALQETIGCDRLGDLAGEMAAHAPAR